MKRYWVSWYSREDDVSGYCEPPFTVWCTGIRCDDNAGTFCSVIDIEDDQDENNIWYMIGQYHPDYEPRFCKLMRNDFIPSPDRFPGFDPQKTRLIIMEKAEAPKLPSHPMSEAELDEICNDGLNNMMGSKASLPTEYRIPDDATGICYMGRGIGIKLLQAFIDFEFGDMKASVSELKSCVDFRGETCLKCNDYMDYEIVRGNDSEISTPFIKLKGHCQLSVGWCRKHRVFVREDTPACDELVLFNLDPEMESDSDSILRDLLHQIEIGDFTDGHGHEAVNLKVYLEAKAKLLSK